MFSNELSIMAVDVDVAIEEEVLAESEAVKEARKPASKRGSRTPGFRECVMKFYPFDKPMSGNKNILLWKSIVEKSNSALTTVTNGTDLGLVVMSLAKIVTSKLNSITGLTCLLTSSVENEEIVVTLTLIGATDVVNEAELILAGCFSEAGRKTRHIISVTSQHKYYEYIMRTRAMLMTPHALSGTKQCHVLQYNNHSIGDLVDSTDAINAQTLQKSESLYVDSGLPKFGTDDEEFIPLLRNRGVFRMRSAAYRLNKREKKQARAAQVPAEPEANVVENVFLENGIIFEDSDDDDEPPAKKSCA